MALNKFAIAASSLAAAGLIAGGATFAYAENTATASPSTQATASAPAAGQGQGDRTQGGAQASQDTPVTADEAQKVIDAVKAKDSTATITEVRKDPDGTYDALGTKADGSRAFYDVSTDLATITENTAGAGGQVGRGGPGGQAGGTSADASGAAQAAGTGS